MISEEEEDKNKKIFFQGLEKQKIKFFDNNFLTDESLLFSKEIKNNNNNIPLLVGNKLIVYEKIKNYSKKGIYPNLKLLILKNEICIQATKNIYKNTLLF